MHQAFKEDIADANAFYKKKSTSKEMKKYIDGALRYYMSSPTEAFAETAATIVYFHPEAEWYNAMSFIFPRMMKLVRAQLVLDKIIPADYAGKGGTPAAAPIPTDIPSGKIMSEARP